MKTWIYLLIGFALSWGVFAAEVPPAPTETFDIHQLKLTDSPHLTELLKNTPDAVRGEDKFLPVDDAFKLSLRLDNSQTLLAYWQITDGYYLYRSKFHFTLNQAGKLGEMQLPAGEMKNDPTHGTTKVYHRFVEIKVPVLETQGLKNLDITVTYQGCADSGLCYPPTEMTFQLPLTATAVPPIPAQSTSQPIELSETDQIVALLENASLGYILLVFFGFGLLLAFTPCVFPMIPILSSIIVGQGNHITTRRAFSLSLIYVLAMAFTYAGAGVIAGSIGENIQIAAQNTYVLITFALIFVLLSLSMFGYYELQLPAGLQNRLTHLSNRQQGGHWLGVAVMGVLSALIVGPCVAAPLAGALMYIGHTGNAVLGGFALFFMGLGMGAPLLLIGISAGHLLPKSGSWMTHVKSVFGVILLGVAIWMVERVLPPPIVLLLWSILFIMSAVFLGAVDALIDNKNLPHPLPHDWQARHHVHGEYISWLKLRKGLGLILLIYGILLMIGAASGATNPLQPLQKLSSGNNATSQPAAVFKSVKGITGLEQALAQAGEKLVLLDIYADWCISCKEMEQFTFGDAKVQQLLANLVLLRANVTANDAQDKELYQRFHLVGPPVVMFFAAGKEQESYRVVGFMNAEQFHNRLRKLLK
jgi:thiol:disulfide interchange protein DsbD